MDVNLMLKNILIKTMASAGTGGIFYGIVVILLNYFAPIVGIIAGLISGVGLVVLSDQDEEDNKDISPANLLYFAGVAIISLLIGYIIVYFLKTEVIHGMPYHPKDFVTLTDFILSTLRIPDILSTMIGGLIAFSLTDKISAVYRYLRRGPSV
jgi:multisubunit Na+/H+ antiporter MnhB subunit